MRNTKKYTNQTFTKRVDHEGGLHRLPPNLKEPAICEKCRAVYENRRWITEKAAREATNHKRWGPAKLTICPACKQIEEGITGGYVSLSGAFFDSHKEEIKHLLTTEERRGMEDNPLSRIMNWREEKDGSLTVETTTEHLAQRFGHALEKAFKGKVKYDFSHENKLARVAWHRD